LKVRTSEFIRCVFIALVFVLGSISVVFSAQKQVVGWVEKIRIVPGNLKIKAKLDTGALNSSLHAVEVKEYTHQGERWVRFGIKNWQNRTATFEKKVIRTARIKEHDRVSSERLVIRLGICLGTVFKEVEVNLIDRSRYKYHMLVGRSFLKDSFVVDPALVFTIDPQCQGE
jgi:hypothetical protein